MRQFSAHRAQGGLVPAIVGGARARSNQEGTRSAAEGQTIQMSCITPTLPVLGRPEKSVIATHSEPRELRHRDPATRLIVASVDGHRIPLRPPLSPAGIVGPAGSLRTWGSLQCPELDGPNTGMAHTRAVVPPG
jgi:hypothetical protein